MDTPIRPNNWWSEEYLKDSYFPTNWWDEGYHELGVPTTPPSTQESPTIEPPAKDPNTSNAPRVILNPVSRSYIVSLNQSLNQVTERGKVSLSTIVSMATSSDVELLEPSIVTIPVTGGQWTLPEREGVRVGERPVIPVPVGVSDDLIEIGPEETKPEPQPSDLIILGGQWETGELIDIEEAPAEPMPESKSSDETSKRVNTEISPIVPVVGGLLLVAGVVGTILLKAGAFVVCSPATPIAGLACAAAAP